MTGAVKLTMPTWVDQELAALPAVFDSVEARMETVIRFSQLNIEQETGGPFAAGVFDLSDGRLAAMGVNRVVASQCSTAHAEVMALSLAQRALSNYDLGSGEKTYQLVVNWRPCAMCYGALVWSGVRSLAIAGSGTELEDITGFDEGPVHPEWKAELERRGIEVIDGILRDKAIAVFRQFRDSGALVYNGRSSN